MANEWQNITDYDMHAGNRLVTILIPTFRRPQKLKRAIESVRKQLYSDILIRVFDNASGDDTAKVVFELTSLDPRVQYHCQEKNVGVIANYNYALKSVNTKYFAFLADDDILFPECIGEAVHGLEANEDVAFWGGGTVNIDESSGRILRGPSGCWKEGGIYFPHEACMRICSGNQLEFQGLVFRTEFVSKHKMCFDPEVMLPDIDFELQLAKYYPVGAAPSITAAMYSDVDSISSGVQSLSTFWPSMSIIERKFIEDSPLPEEVNKDCLLSWQKHTLRTIWYIGLKCAFSSRVAESYEASDILKGYFGNSFASIFARWSILASTRGRFLARLVWVIHIVVRIAIKPSILIDKINAYKWKAIISQRSSYD